MVRSGKYNRHGRTTGPTYLSEDNYKLKIIMHIYANGESYKNKIKHDSAGGLTSIEGTDLNLSLAKKKKK